jgi:hypothetical protein
MKSKTESGFFLSLESLESLESLSLSLSLFS